VAGTIYEAIHNADFSNIPFLSAIKVYGLICTVAKPSLLSFLNVTDQASHPQLWKHYVNTHTHLYFNWQVIRKQRIAKLYQHVVSITPN